MKNTSRGSSTRSLLKGARVYLSGPMDFVASREEEMKNGWRNRVGEFLRACGCIVFDPWHKPAVRGLQDTGARAWTRPTSRAPGRSKTARGAPRHAPGLRGKFWETLHIDLRMVDTSDFTIAYCPTNIYSVGTPHEIVLCRQQRKPVLFVSPPVEFPRSTTLRGTSRRRDARARSSSTELGGRGANQAEPARHPEPLVHAARRRRELLRRLRVRQLTVADIDWRQRSARRREKKRNAEAAAAALPRAARAQAAAEMGSAAQELRRETTIGCSGIWSPTLRAPKSPVRTKRSETAGGNETGRDAAAAGGWPRSSRRRSRADAGRGSGFGRRVPGGIDRLPRAVAAGTVTRALTARARRAFLHLGGDPARPSASLKDYDHVGMAPSSASAMRAARPRQIREAASHRRRSGRSEARAAHAARVGLGRRRRAARRHRRSCRRAG